MYTHISLKLFDLHFFVRLILKDKSKASTLLLSRYITAFSYTKKCLDASKLAPDILLLFIVRST